jgi:hypothetical protein
LKPHNPKHLVAQKQCFGTKFHVLPTIWVGFHIHMPTMPKLQLIFQNKRYCINIH